MNSYFVKNNACLNKNQKTLMKNFDLLIICILLSISNSINAQMIEGSFEHDGETREYVFYMPTTYVPGSSVPLVLNLHGLSSNNQSQAFYSNFNVLAEAHNFIVVYPQGLVGLTPGGVLDTHWNAYFGSGVDDIGFLSKLIDRFYFDYNIDLSRVYSTGMSNGGYMSYVLACDMSDRIAAIASVTGSMLKVLEDNCNPDRPIPVMQIHGTLDAVVAYNLPTVFQGSIPDIVQFWVNHNNCDATPTVTDVPNNSIIDLSTATREDYGDCDDNTAVAFYIIEGGGHTWPGALPFPALGNTNQDFDASEKIWEFFSQHTHPNPAEVVTDVEEVQALSNLTIAPNPFHNELKVQFPSSALSVQLVDNLGKVYFFEEIAAGNTEFLIDATDLPKGIYVLTVNTRHSLISKKVVKK